MEENNVDDASSSNEDEEEEVGVALALPRRKSRGRRVHSLVAYVFYLLRNRQISKFAHTRQVLSQCRGTISTSYMYLRLVGCAYTCREEAEADEQFWGQSAFMDEEEDLDYDSTDSASFARLVTLRFSYACIYMQLQLTK